MVIIQVRDYGDPGQMAAVEMVRIYGYENQLCAQSTQQSLAHSGNSINVNGGQNSCSYNHWHAALPPVGSYTKGNCSEEVGQVTKPSFHLEDTAMEQRKASFSRILHQRETGSSIPHCTAVPRSLTSWGKGFEGPLRIHSSTEWVEMAGFSGKRSSGWLRPGIPVQALAASLKHEGISDNFFFPWPNIRETVRPSVFAAPSGAVKSWQGESGLPFWALPLTQEESAGESLGI